MGAHAQRRSQAAKMKSTLIAADTLGDSTVSTVFIEPFNYFETAIKNKRGTTYEIVESQMATREQADETHRAAMETVEKAQAYRER